MTETTDQESPTQIAEKHIQGGYNCAQTVLAAYAARYGLTEKEARRIACCFGGGMGRRGEVCGAVSGALMVLGLHHWDDEADLAATKERAYILSAEFMDRFAASHGTNLCRELLGADLRDPQQLERARDDGLFTSLCPGFIRDAMALLEEFI